MVVSNYRSLLSYDYVDKLLRLENVKLFSRQDKILYIIDTTILILYRKLYINTVSIIVLNIEADNTISRLILLYCAALSFLFMSFFLRTIPFCS